VGLGGRGKVGGRTAKQLGAQHAALEGRKQQQQGSACLQNSTQTRREVSLNNKNFFLMVNPYKI
jgi:hypothetical protein